MTRIHTASGLAIALMIAGCSIEQPSDIEAEAGGAAPSATASDLDTPGAQGTDLQQRVDEVLASIPGGQQVSATEIDYDGLTVTFDPNHSLEKSALAPLFVTCSPGWFCIVVGDTKFEFFKCKMWDLSNWVGDAPFNNNQSPGTVAKAYGQDVKRGAIWRNTAPDNIDRVNVTPWWHFQPCGGPG